MQTLNASQLSQVVGGILVPPPVGFQPNLQSIRVGLVLSGPQFTNNFNPRFGSGAVNFRVVGIGVVGTGFIEEC